ncbi:MAG: hypothetical protein C0410_02930 [Anaerolinea sp.]|nr:hypothetical protein [Anaerolinea sp.]
MENTHHYSNEQLIDFLEGRLDALSSAELSKHLKSGCHVCINSLALYERMFSAIQCLRWQSPAPSSHKRVISAFSLHYPEKTKPKTKFLPFLRPALIGFTILALVVYAFLFPLNPGVVYAGYIENVTGQVEMLDPSTGLWKPVSPGQSVPINATIHTKNDAQVTISFPGGEKTILAAESEVRLESIINSQGLWEVSLDQTSGQTENQTSSSTSSFSVKTSAVVVNSSNAHFMTSVQADGSVIANVFEGDVKALSHSEIYILHSGETKVFPSDKYATLVSPTIADQGIDPTITPTLFGDITKTPDKKGTIPSSTPKITKTPNINGNKSSTPTPEVEPTQENNSTTADITCPPGNSHNSGKSGDANNSDSACK